MIVRESIGLVGYDDAPERDSLEKLIQTATTASLCGGNVSRLRS